MYHTKPECHLLNVNIKFVQALFLTTKEDPGQKLMYMQRPFRDKSYTCTQTLPHRNYLYQHSFAVVYIGNL